MKASILLFALLVVGTFAGPAQSVPLVSINWDHCTGPTDRKLGPGQPAAIYASVLGQTQPHKAYQVQLRIYSAYTQIPDAWRFDAGGCQGPAHLTIDHVAPPEVAAVCSSFKGTLPSQYLTDYSFDTLSGRIKTQLFVAYPNGGAGNTQQVNPALRYFLGRWGFDGELWAEGPTIPGQTCGGLDNSMCIGSFSLSNSPASWVDLAGNTVEWAFSNEAISVLNGGFGQIGCPFSSPAVNRTWGAVKNQYR